MQMLLLLLHIYVQAPNKLCVDNAIFRSSLPWGQMADDGGVITGQAGKFCERKGTHYSVLK